MYKFLESRNQTEFQKKIVSGMEESGINSLILTSPQNITYSTGYIPTWTYGCGADSWSDVVVINDNGQITLITSQFTYGGAVLQTKGEIEIIDYPTYIFIEDYYDPNETSKKAQNNFDTIFRLASKLLNKGEKKVGIEYSNITYNNYQIIKKYLSNYELIDCTSMLNKLRSIKLPWEIDVLKYAATITEKMMSYTRKHTQIGMTEAELIKVWNESAYVFTQGHELVGIVQSHTLGQDFWMTGLPRENKIQEGDIIRLDGGINIYGYLSDLGRTYSVGNIVDVEKKNIFSTLLQAYKVGLKNIAPGKQISDVYDIMLQTCRQNGLPNYIRGHFGHGIGLGPDEEEPFIAPDNNKTFMPGMVFCIETPYYSSKHNSYNLEDTFVVTENGIELFTHTNSYL